MFAYSTGSSAIEAGPSIGADNTLYVSSDNGILYALASRSASPSVTPTVSPSPSITRTLTPTPSITPTVSPFVHPWGQRGFNQYHSGQSVNAGPAGPLLVMRFVFSTLGTVLSSPVVSSAGSVIAGSSDGSTLSVLTQARCCGYQLVVALL